MSCVTGAICATVLSLSLLLLLLHLDHVHQHLDQQQNSPPQKRLQAYQAHQDLPDQDLLHQDLPDQDLLHQDLPDQDLLHQDLPDQDLLHQDLPDQDLFHQDQQDQPWLHSQNHLEKARLQQDQHQPLQESTGTFWNVQVYQDQDKPHPHPHQHPCLPIGGHVYDRFLTRHLPHGQPSSGDQNAWQRFIKAHRLCRRPTQSFLDPADQEQVEQVCTPGSGRVLRNNLCISTHAFTFYTVRLHNKKHCEVHSVKQEHKHIILGCDRVNNTCLPVHFEGNPGGEEPGPDQPPCQAPRNSGEDHQDCQGWGVTLLLFSISLPMVL